MVCSFFGNISTCQKEKTGDGIQSFFLCVIREQDRIHYFYIFKQRGSIHACNIQSKQTTTEANVIKNLGNNIKIDFSSATSEDFCFKLQVFFVGLPSC